MATIRNFTKDLNDVLARARANGLTDVKILLELFTEAVMVNPTEVAAVKPIEPILTITAIPSLEKKEICQTVKQLFSYVAKSKKMSLPAKLEEAATSLPAKLEEAATSLPATREEAATSLPATREEAATSLPATREEAATSLPATREEAATSLPATREEAATSLPATREEAAAPIAKKEFIREAKWADIRVTEAPSRSNSAAASSTEVLNWHSFAMAAFEEDFTPVPAKPNDSTIIFQIVPFQGMHNAIFTADSKSFSTKGLREFIVKKDAAAFSAWIQDTMNWSKGLDADGNREFALRKLIQLFIPFFFKHNLKDSYNKKKGDFPTVEHMEYCISNVVTVTAAKKMNPVHNDLRTYFKLSAEEAPSEAILREVAVIQAMQQFVLKEIHTILSLSKIGKSIVRTTDFLQLEFHTQEGLTKFCETIKYDQKLNGWL